MPKRIGRYELGKVLGSGNYSKVKLAIDVETNTKWALKIIDKEQLQRERMEEQLKREIAVLKQLKHPFIVGLREVMQTANHIYLVLQLVTGGELFEKIVQAKKFDEATSRRYFQQLILGLRYAHSLGIAHRDIKPENILVDDNHIVHITDFGLSNLQPKEGQGLLQTVCGTPNYVAPDVLKEKGYNGFAADAWSCGVVLFVMLAGYLPFDDPNVNALFNKIERGDYRFPRHFSEPVRDLIGKLLTVDPTKRMTLDECVQHPWFQEGLAPIQAMVDATAARPIAEPSAADVKNAISDAKESDTDKRGDIADGSTNVPVDAFQLLSFFTAGATNPFAQPELDVNASITGVSRRTFLCVGSTTLNDVVTALSKLKIAARVNAGEAKAFVNTPRGGLLTFRVVAIPVAGGLCLVQFGRGRGDSADFVQLVESVVQAMPPGSVKSQFV
jgi:5'-AMP-activated protein kinase catalytic alpha subunit